MNLWFEQILPYLVLVIFHLNSSQVDCLAAALPQDQPADPTQALYCPPGAPFGPVHVTKYPPNPAYAEYGLETILIADPLARTRETEYIGHEEKRIEVPSLLFKDKYNYLPAYFVPMTPPLTPRPNCPIETPTAAETTYTQLFGVLYITLKGMADSMVPNSGPWSLLGKSMSYIIKLAPILWWALPAGLAHPIPSHPMPLPMPGFLKFSSLWSFVAQQMGQCVVKLIATIKKHWFVFVSGKGPTTSSPQTLNGSGPNTGLTVG
ncbi:hypothetical protein DSO57_1019399 [Entomophthora muscae]|uniref:Uncharacterized protein n=1 Tax=Entomophthora muscae TaxID=34485 RepID=A0ACC2UCV2_9FUNG|nr:hypothetical protein DSO57_1019399 [Entomophthora muscae]